MKPESWEQIPSNLQEQLLWDCELEYDPYESSKAERVHEIMCGNIYKDNKRIVDTAWRFMSEETYRSWLVNERDSLREKLKEIEGLLDNPQS